MGRKPCCSKEEVSRGAWSFQEDQILINYINTHGQGKWRALPLNSGLNRCGKSCRLRWLNYLRPGIKKGDISKDEEDLTIRLHTLLGNRWSLIAGRLPGRTDNEIKNYSYWNTYLAKRQKSPSIRGDSRRETLVNNGQKQVPYVNNNLHIIRTKAIRYNSFKPLVNNQDQIAHHSQIAKTEPSNEHLGFLVEEDRVDVGNNTGLGEHCGVLVDANGIEIKMDDKVVEEEQKLEMNLMIELKKMASFLEVEDEWIQ